jgi:hypothetical protein
LLEPRIDNSETARASRTQARTQVEAAPSARDRRKAGLEAIQRQLDIIKGMQPCSTC